MRALARGIALLLMGSATATYAAPGEPLGPAERLFDTVQGQSALPSFGMTPDGRHAVSFVAASPSLNGLLADLSHAPYWMPAWDTALRLQLDGHASIVSPSVSISRYGYPLVAWERRNTSYLSDGLYLRYHDAQGNPIGGLVRVDQQLARQTQVIRTASNGYGTRHVVVWGADRGGSRDARVRWFDNALQPLGDETRVDVGGLDVHAAVDVALLPGIPDQAVIAYIGLSPTAPQVHDTLYLRKIDAYGQLAEPIAVAAGTGETGWRYFAETPSLATAADGGFVAVWRVLAAQSGTTQRWVQLRAQRFDATLAPLAASFAVTPQRANNDAYLTPDVAAASGGGFAVVWRERSEPGAAVQIRLQRFDADGVAVGASTNVAEGALDLLQPTIALDADADALVGWTEILADGSVQAMRRRYRGDGQVDLALSGIADVDLAPGESTLLTLAVQNNSAPTNNAIDSGRDYASGITLTLQPDPSLTVAASPQNGWLCAGSDELVCSLNAIVATGSAAPALELHVQAGSAYGSYAVQATLSGDQDDLQVGNNGALFAVHVLDQVPDAFGFPAADNVARGSSVVSGAQQVGGFDGALQASVTGGELSVNGAAFSASPVPVSAGDSLRLRHTAASTFSTSTVTTLAIGGVAATFTSTTETADTTPDNFAFSAAGNVIRNAIIDSAPVTITGINAATAISVSNGSYSLDGGPFTSVAGQVNAGQQVRLQHTSASGYNTSTTSTLSIGGISASFVSTTEAMDTTPNAFDFVDLLDAPKRTTVNSNVITVTGINAPATLTLSGGGASFAVNGGSFGTAARQVLQGDQVRLRLTTPNSSLTAVTVTVNIGGVSDVWHVKTGRK